MRERLGAAAPGEHPDADTLAAFTEHALGKRERLSVMKHLAVCAACRQTLLLAAPEQPKPAGGEPWRLRWTVARWGVAAACAAALAGVVMVRYQRRTMRTIERSAPAGVQPAAPAAALAPPSGTPAETARREAAQTANDAFVANGNLRGALPGRPDARARRNTRERNSTSAAVGSEFARGENLRANGAARGAAAPPAATPSAPSVVMGGASATAKLDKEEAPELKAPAGRAEVAMDKASRAAEKPLPADLIASVKKSDASRAKTSAFDLGTAAAPAPSAPPVAPQSEAAPTVAARTGSENAPSANLQEVAPAFTAGPGGVRQGASAGIVAGVGGGYGQGENPPRWSISEDGALERSLDSGQTWTKVAVGNGTKFRVVSAAGLEIWAGGDDGALFHSADGGAHWARVRPSAGGVALRGVVVRIEFSDALQGLVRTDSGQDWVTADGGQTWHRR